MSGALAGALSDQQIRSFVESTARLNIWEGSIRSGKTVISLLRWLDHVAKAPRSGELLMFGKTREAVARNIFGPLMSPELFGPLARQIHYTSGAPTATILGRTVHVIGANDAKAEPKVRGMTCVGAYGDELTVCPEPFFKQVLGRLSVPGAKLFGTTNPDAPNHWLRRDYLLRAADLDLRTWHFTIDDNPHLDPEYVESIKQEYTGLWYRRFILGHWVQAEGAIYDMWDENLHVVDELPGIARVLALGVDYGTKNPFAGLLLALTTDGRLAFTREYRHDSRQARRQLTDAEYAAALRAPGGLLDERPEFIAVDPSAASFKVQLHKDGVTGVRDAANSVEDGIRTVASLLACRRLVVHRTCKGLIDEIPGYSWDDEAAEKGEDKPIKVDDHSCDAARYAVLTTRQLWMPHVPLRTYAAA